MFFSDNNGFYYSLCINMEKNRETITLNLETYNSYRPLPMENLETMSVTNTYVLKYILDAMEDLSMENNLISIAEDNIRRIVQYNYFF